MNVSGLIIGLGNPGREYDRTRHNFGFLFIDALLEAAQRSPFARCEQLSSGKKKYELWRCDVVEGQDPWLLAKPQTFMNLSGEAVLAIASYYRVKPAAMVVAHDELDLPLGRMRFKKGGGNAGHNGLKSITQCLGTPEFHRLRLGIGKPPAGGETTGWVLGRFSQTDSAVVDTVLEAAMQGIRTFATEGEVAATQYINAFRP